jgi:hypothetical protein
MSCNSCKYCNSAMPQTPPPSRVNTRTPAVSGRVFTTTPDVVRSHKKHRPTSKSHGSASLLPPKVLIQLSQIQCPHGRPYCGLLRRQTRQVSSERRASHCLLCSKRSLRCKLTDVVLWQLRSSKHFERASSIILAKPDGRTMYAECWWANNPSLDA